MCVALEDPCLRSGCSGETQGAWELPRATREQLTTSLNVSRLQGLLDSGARRPHENQSTNSEDSGAQESGERAQLSEPHSRSPGPITPDASHCLLLVSLLVERPGGETWGHRGASGAASAHQLGTFFRGRLLEVSRTRLPCKEALPPKHQRSGPPRLALLGHSTHKISLAHLPCPGRGPLHPRSVTQGGLPAYTEASGTLATSTEL